MKKKNTLIVIASCPPLPCLSPELRILHSSASQGYKQHGKTLGMDLYLKKKIVSTMVCLNIQKPDEYIFSQVFYNFFFCFPIKVKNVVTNLNILFKYSPNVTFHPQYSSN